MDPTRRFASKAEKYARYRWDYNPRAIQLILDTTRISRTATVADIGAGTGMLARHFLGQAERVYAVEPNLEMRLWADQALGHIPGFVSINGRAEATTLADHCTDLIVVGQALHWFDPEAAWREFQRILNPGGWLAVLWNSGDDPALKSALQAISTPDGRPPAQPIGFYYGGDFIQQAFPLSQSQTWEIFFGALCSDSHAPDEAHPCFARFEAAARGVFEQFCVGDQATITCVTELFLGQMSGPC
jgi:SAM-dependent methyltransferase